MTTADVLKWKRCEELSVILQISISVRTYFELTDKKKLYLGAFGTVDEVLAFLYGYAWVSPTKHKNIDAIKAAKKETA